LIQKGEIGPEEAKKAVEDEDEDDEDKYAEDVDMPGQKFESKQRITVRNLRIREDTAKVSQTLMRNVRLEYDVNYHRRPKRYIGDWQQTDSK